MRRGKIYLLGLDFSGHGNVGRSKKPKRKKKTVCTTLQNTLD